MSAFSKKSDPSAQRPKAPTSYQFFKSATKAQQKLRPAVEAIFEPTEKMKSWGFCCPQMRFNIYEEDVRFSECPTIAQEAVANGWMLRIVYDESERGLATLEFDKKLKGEWVKVGNRWWFRDPR